jgi:hypothetical protein
MTDENENGGRPLHEDDEFVTGSHYAKIFGSILMSSVWEESAATRCVWVAMLVSCDRDGFVETSDPGLYRKANVTPSEGKEALRILAAPDVNSKSQEWGGRRIERVRAGWKILNYEKYRDAKTRTQLEAQRRVEAMRQREADGSNYQLPDGSKDARGYVYFARAEDEVKIGFTKNPWARITALKTARPSIELLATERGTPATEAGLHTRFAADRISTTGAGREWFRWSPAIAEYVENLKAGRPNDPPTTNADGSTTVATTAPVVAPSVAVSVALASTTSGSGGDVGNRVEEVDNSDAAMLERVESWIVERLESDLDREAFVAIMETSGNPYAWAAECRARLQGMHPPTLTPRQLGEALRDYWANGHTKRPNFKHFRAHLARPDRPKDEPSEGGGVAGPSGKGPDGSTGEAGAILTRLKGGSLKGEPDEIRRAVEALGGLGAVKDCRPDRWGLLVRDFVAHLAFARANPAPELPAPPAPEPVIPRDAEESPAMRRAREREEAWLAEHPGEALPKDFHLKPPPKKGGLIIPPEV